MKSEFLATKEAPQAVGAYSQGVKTGAGEMIFMSGQLPIDMESGEMVTGDIGKETTICLKGLIAVLKAGGGVKEDIVKVTIYVTDIKDFTLINEAYAEFFGDHKPARVLVEVSRLPKDADIEIEAIAVI